MGTKSEQSSQSSKSLKEKIKALEEITNYFAQEEVDLDEGIKKYEEGMKLAKEIREKLTAYELKINEIKAKYDEDSDGLPEESSSSPSNADEEPFLN